MKIYIFEGHVCVICRHLLAYGLNENNNCIEVSFFGTHSLINYIRCPKCEASSRADLECYKRNKTHFDSQNQKQRTFNLGKWKFLYFVSLQLVLCQLQLSQWQLKDQKTSTHLTSKFMQNLTMSGYQKD